MEQLELLDKLNSVKGYKITLTTIDNEGKLEHLLLLKDFPDVDMISAHAEELKIIQNHLNLKYNIS